MQSTSSAATATTGPVASATIPTPSATLAGGVSTPVPPEITGTGVPGTELAETIRSAIGSAKTVRMSMTNQAGTGSALVDLEHKAVRLVAGADTNPVTLVHRDGTTWVKGAGSVTQTTRATPTGTSTVTPPAVRSTKTWLRLRPDGSDVLSRELGPAVNIEQALRPDAFTAMFDGVLGDQTKTDSGTRTSFWVQAGAYVSAVGGSESLAKAITAPVTVVVELDDESRPTKLTATIPAGKSTIVDETRYSDWGKPVTIEAPNPDDVADAPLPEGGATATDAPAPTDASTASDQAQTPGASDAATGATPSATDSSAPTTGASSAP